MRSRRQASPTTRRRGNLRRASITTRRHPVRADEMVNAALQLHRLSCCSVRPCHRHCSCCLTSSLWKCDASQGSRAGFEPWNAVEFWNTVFELFFWKSEEIIEKFWNSARAGQTSKGNGLKADGNRLNICCWWKNWLLLYVNGFWIKGVELALNS